MSRSIHLAIASTSSLPGEVTRNLDQIAGFAWLAARDGADLLLTPELSASGYGNYPEVLATAEIAGQGPISQRALTISADTGVVIGIGFAEQGTNGLHISHFFAFPNGRFVVQRKNRPMRHEAPFVRAKGPTAVQPFLVHGVRCGTLICADAGLRKRNALLRAAEVELALLPAGAGGKRVNRVTTQELATQKGRANYSSALQELFWPGWCIDECLVNRRAHAMVNLVGHDGRDHYHSGHGAIINSFGEVVAFFPGQPNLDRQRPTYTHNVVEIPVIS
jgi:predicted amidohydrolase